MMHFSTTLIAVRDMDRALRFYKEMLGQEVACDLGWNKTLTCGLTLQEHFDKIAGFDEETMQFRTHNMELYFETDDIDAFMVKLDAHPEIERLHGLRTFPWKQRGIHIYDPDGHLLEVSESMESVAHREFAAGKSIEETAEAIQHPVDLVRLWHETFVTSVCGTYCPDCDYYGKECNGCNVHAGKVFHSPDGCGIYRCARGEKGLHDCSACRDLPCATWRAMRDPRYSDAEFEKSITDRIAVLKQLKEKRQGPRG